MVVFNKNIDFFLIKFPIIFPIIYLSFLFSFPEYGYLIAFTTLLLLAEPHFGATWTIFADSKMKYFAKKNNFLFFSVPILICILSVFLFFKFVSIFYILFFAFNVYHVTRQSVGICKLFSPLNTEKLFQEYCVYIVNILSFGGIFAYHLINIINENIALNLGFILLGISLIIILIERIYFKNWERSLTTFTGLIMFIPGLFVSEPIHALLAGITMHYTQYLAMTLRLTITKFSKVETSMDSKINSLIKSKYLLIIITYGTIATIITSLSTSNKDEIFEYLIIIPILGQILHFYIDGLVWRFSNKELRDINLKYLVRQSKIQ